MDQRLVTQLEGPFATCGLEAETAREVILMGLAWPTEYWAGLAIAWLEQGAPLDAELVVALDAVASKTFAQGVRHRAFALAQRGQRAESTPNPSFRRTPGGAA